MKKLILLFSILLALGLTAVGLHPEILTEGYKKGMFDADIALCKEKSGSVLKPLFAKFMKGPDKGQQGGELTPEELAAMGGSTTGTTNQVASTGTSTNASTSTNTPDPKVTGTGTPPATAIKEHPELKDLKGDVTTYALDEFACRVAFTGYATGKQQDCWFEDITGKLELVDGEVEGGRLHVEIYTDSLAGENGVFVKVALGNYLEVDDYETAKFTSSSIKKKEGDTYRVVGVMTIKAHSKPIAFDAVIPVDGDSASVTSDFKLNRQDFGLTYNGIAGYAINDEFSLKVELEAEKE